MAQVDSHNGNSESSEKSLMTKENIRVDSDLIEADGCINGYIEPWFNVEEYFGIKMDDGEYIDVYVDYYPETRELQGKYQISCSEPEYFGDSIFFDLEKSEKSVILIMMKEVGLDEIINNMKERGCEVLDEDIKFLLIQREYDDEDWEHSGFTQAIDDYVCYQDAENDIKDIISSGCYDKGLQHLFIREVRDYDFIESGYTEEDGSPDYSYYVEMPDYDTEGSHYDSETSISDFEETRNSAIGYV
jgi:hypothetical protein